MLHIEFVVRMYRRSHSAVTVDIKFTYTAHSFNKLNTKPDVSVTAVKLYCNCCSKTAD